MVLRRICEVLMFIGGVCFALDSQAQDETMRILQTDVSEYRNDTLWTSAEQPTLILVPFEPIMYRSQIDRSIGMNDGTNHEQIVGNWRRGLDNVLFIETDAKYSVIRLLADDEGRKKDLYSVYGATSGEYRSLPEPKEEEKTKKKLKLPKLKTEPEEEKKTGSSIQNGQLVASGNNDGKFMARKVNDDGIFDYLYGKYGSVLYVTINQFDIGPMSGLDYRAYESDEYQRQITVHYSVFTHKNELYSGIATTYFSSTMNSQKEIIVQNFPEIAKQIASHVPQIIVGDVQDAPTEE